jgi:hypothetical protein
MQFHLMPYKARLSLLGICLAILFFSRSYWESGMVMHIAGQIPLLVVLGGVFASLQQRRYPGLITIGQHYRTSLLLFAVFVLGLWMVPRLLDAALHDPLIAFSKWLSLPLAGMALVWCWRHLPAVLRALLHLEALAMLLRLGWLYLLAPQRYCVSYTFDEQEVLGYTLITYGIIYGVLMGMKVMFGHIKPRQTTGMTTNKT